MKRYTDHRRHGTRADGERSGVGTLCNLFVLRNKALSLYSVRLSISTTGLLINFISTVIGPGVTQAELSRIETGNYGNQK